MATATVEKGVDVADTCTQLQELQRQRVSFLKTRIKVDNGLLAAVAIAELNYNVNLDKAERAKAFVEAAAFITKFKRGEVTSDIGEMIQHTSEALKGFTSMVKKTEKVMLPLAKSLPAASWTMEKDQRGFGLLSLGVVIGETGDLGNYDCVAKFWKRMQCAPYEKNGETMMGAQWQMRKNNKKGETKLNSQDWVDYGYVPRRRAVSYLIGENIVRQNDFGPYRKKYIQVKKDCYVKHPEWKWNPCEKCDGCEGICPTCGGMGFKCMHAHRHGMLLATKLLFKKLYLEWHQLPWKEWEDNRTTEEM